MSIGSLYVCILFHSIAFEAWEPWNNVFCWILDMWCSPLEFLLWWGVMVLALDGMQGGLRWGCTWNRENQIDLNWVAGRKVPKLWQAVRKEQFLVRVNMIISWLWRIVHFVRTSIIYCLILFWSYSAKKGRKKKERNSWWVWYSIRNHIAVGLWCSLV